MHEASPLLDLLARDCNVSLLEVVVFVALAFAAGALFVIFANCALEARDSVARVHRDLGMIRHLRDREGRAVNS